MISGEKFQQLAEISICSKIDCIIENQLRSMKQNLVTIDELQPENIKNYNKIFVYTHHLPDFFNKYFEHLNSNIILITHNSDHCVNETFLKYLECDKISKWFCQNKHIEHPKLYSLPIGIANSQWAHGDQEMIKSIRNTHTLKSNLVFKNFDKATNVLERSICDDITNKNGIPMSPRVTNKEYLSNIACSMFVISPPGNGIDCHRIWECLYLRTIPVTLNHTALNQFKHLPILFVDNWEEVTVEFLQLKVSYYNTINWDIINELDIQYWKDLI